MHKMNAMRYYTIVIGEKINIMYKSAIRNANEKMRIKNVGTDNESKKKYSICEKKITFK